MSRATKLWLATATLLVIVAGGVLYYGPREVFQHLYLVLTEDTEYAPNYSEKAFWETKIGDTETEVRASLGEPLHESEATPMIAWLYTDEPHPRFSEAEEYPDLQHSFTRLRFQDGKLIDVFGQLSGGQGAGGGAVLASVGPGENTLSLSVGEIDELVRAGTTPEEMQARFGPPTERHEARAVKWLHYSHSPGSTNYRKRRIAIDADGRVCRIDSEIYWD